MDARKSDAGVSHYFLITRRYHRPARRSARRRPRSGAAGADRRLLAASLHFIKANVEAGATAKTDGWSGYSGAPGIDHDPHVVGSITALIILPWTHRVFANLKTWAFGVYHGLREKAKEGEHLL